ncbi:reverse transcriptase domain-containing protein [Tanacetum coccineum]
MNATSSKTDERIDKLTDQLSTLVEIVSKNVVTPASVKAVEESCVTCGGAHLWYNCPSTDNNQSSGTLIPTNPSPKKVVERETEETTNKEQSNFQESTAQIPPLVIPISILEPDVPKSLPKPTPIPEPDVSKMMLLKKLPEKLGDPDKFLIPCDFLGMDVCHALVYLGVSINLMPLSIWKNLSLPELTPTRMTLELADRSITHPKGLAEDVTLKTGRALIDVYGEEITLRVDNEAVTFNLDQTTRYSSTNDDSLGGNPTPTSEPFTSEFILEEIEAYLKDDSISPEIDYANCNPEEDIFTKAKSSIEEPPKLELKELPSHLEYAYLEENEKLPVIIAKGLKDDEKEALLNVLKSHK